VVHPKLFPAVLASLQLNPMMIGEASEEIAVWLEKEGATETVQRLRAPVGDLRFNAEIMDEAIIELLKTDESVH
jgi:hypothetical protein